MALAPSIMMRAFSSISAFALRCSSEWVNNPASKKATAKISERTRLNLTINFIGVTYQVENRICWSAQVRSCTFQDAESDPTQEEPRDGPQSIGERRCPRGVA